MVVVIGNQKNASKEIGAFSAFKEENLLLYKLRKVGISVAFSWQEQVYQLLEQNIITQIFKNKRSFVHRKAAQRDFGEWDIS